MSNATVPAAVTLTVSEVLFDLDGTLIDSIADVERAWGQWAEEFHVERLDHHNFHGRTARTIIESLLPADQVQAAFDRLEDLEANPADDVVLLPGSAALTSALPADRWAIVTSGTERVASARLAAAGLQRPAHMVTANQVTRSKPDPEPYRLGARRAVDAPAGLVFEDAVAGLRSGRAAGNITVAIAGTSPADQLRPEADYVIASLADVRYLGESPEGLLQLELRNLL